jgi:DNA-directed RNA polymerase subunit RPC12/RpoP
MDDLPRRERMLPPLATLATRVSGWEASHPQATLVEMEAAVDAAWAAARAEVLGAWANAQPQADLTSQPLDERPVCPDCGSRLQADGRRRRTIRLDGDQSLTLERTYARCPTCGSGLFPPG